MAGHIDFSHSDTTNLNSIHEALTGVSRSNKSILQKIESSLQTSVATVSYRNNNCTIFHIRFGNEDIEYSAVLAFDKKLYTVIGMPKLGDSVIVVHNNGNNAHILFVANDKNIDDPPYLGSSTTFSKSISSSKCMG